LTPWQRWWRRPQRTGLRRFLFQIHLWSGISLGLYIFFISVTGSVLVYRNELVQAALPRPPLSSSNQPVLSDTQLKDQVLLSFPGYEITYFRREANENEAVEIWLKQGENRLRYYFDSRTGENVGELSLSKLQAVNTLMELHKSFLLGDTGVVINGIGAMAIVLLATTGFIIWWPGRERWRSRMLIHRGVNWKRQIWETHQALGIWGVVFILMFALSGVYLCFPEIFHQVADRIEPITDNNAGQRLVDELLYWLAFLHFGRLNGIALPCSGPGVCDQSFKAIWAVLGILPALMFMTGATMWWNRVLRRWYRQHFTG